MSDNKQTVTVRSNSGGFAVPWLIIFIVLKVMGNAYVATWSWWWLLLPIVPVLAALFKALGAI